MIEVLRCSQVEVKESQKKTKICNWPFAYGRGSQVLTDPSLWSQGLAPGGGKSAFIPLRRTGTMRKELREAEFGKHN